MLRSCRDLTVLALALLGACSTPEPASTETPASAAPPATQPQPPAATTQATSSGGRQATGSSGARAQQPASGGMVGIPTAGNPGGAPAAAGSSGGGGTTPMAAAAGAAGSPTSAEPGACSAMVAAAKAFISTLDSDALKTAALHPFEQHHNFAYEPQVADRPGVPLSMLSAAQEEKALALIHAGLSDEGFEKAETTRALENLKAVTGFQVSMRDPKYYWVAVFGDPSETGEWAFQIEGHHLALHYTLKACAISDTPTFMGAWPSEVANMVAGGPPPGSRNLEQEEELGRALAKSLDTDATKRMQAFQAGAYRQMLPQGPDKAQPMMPAGLAASAMSESERMQLWKIVSYYASVMHPQLAAARLQRIEQHGGIDKLSFAWTGELEPKQLHFYRIQGESFFIEYRNDDGNHIHSAWRDFSGDWGDDLP
jgi:hypothetical protein